MSEFSFMKTTVKYIAPSLAAAAIGFAIAHAPIANADPNPRVPYGTNPTDTSVFGHHVDNQDEANTTNGFVDVPF
jgi:hypothetical protein